MLVGRGRRSERARIARWELREMNLLFSRILRQDIIHLHTFYGPSVRGAEKIAIYSASSGIFWESCARTISIFSSRIFEQRRNEKYTMYVIDKHTIEERKSFSIQMNHEIPIF